MLFWMQEAVEQQAAAAEEVRAAAAEVREAVAAPVKLGEEQWGALGCRLLALQTELQAGSNAFWYLSTLHHLSRL